MQDSVFCVDFDETLFATDRLRADLHGAIEQQFSAAVAERYQAAYEATRQQGGVSIPSVLWQLRQQNDMTTEQVSQIAELFHTFPYQQYVYDGAEAALMHLKTLGTVLILSDGDAFFQAKKIYATSLAAMVDQVIIVPNKVEYFEQLQGFYPARTYVFVDDKPRVLDSARQYFGDAARTVHVRQGRYAQEEPLHNSDKQVQSISGITQSFLI